MKKLVSFIMSMIMLFSTISTVSITTFANTSGDYEYSVLDDGTAGITKYNGNGVDVTIPSMLDGYTVTSIGTSAFENHSNLTSVSIGNNVKVIEGFAFCGCSELLSVVMPKSIEYINYAAFRECTNLKNVYYSGTFSEWYKIGISVQWYDDNQCLTDSNIHCEDGLINQPSGDYQYNVKYSDGVAQISHYVGNSGNVIIPSTIDGYKIGSIGSSAFEYYRNLADAVTPDSVINLTDVTIPEGVTIIGDGAFICCSNLKSVGIPKSVNSIEESAFAHCTSLTDIYYSGTAVDWEKISIDKSYNDGFNNEYLINANIHYNSILPELTVPAEPSNHIIPTPPAQPTTPAAPFPSALTVAKEKAPAGAKKVNGEWVAKKQKNAKIKKLTKAKKSFKATWKKVSGVTGYQIQYSTSKKFSKKTTKSITIKKNKTTSKTVKKLKAKKKYYVRIRTYKNVKLNGKTVKVYSSWSKAKTVKVK